MPVQRCTARISDLAIFIFFEGFNFIHFVGVIEECFVSNVYHNNLVIWEHAITMNMLLEYT